MLLGIWEEVIGSLKHVEVNEKDRTVTLLLLSRGALIEINVSYGVMDYKSLIGCKIGILRTDDPQRPYLIRMIKVSEGFASREEGRL